MADSLGIQGKIQGMEGIRSQIISASLSGSGGGVATTTVAPSDFAVSTSTGTEGQISNTSAISFTIGSEDVGNTATQVTLNATGGAMIFIDLDVTVELTTEGTATIAIGDLTADL